jgi:hypothetical protein
MSLWFMPVMGKGEWAMLYMSAVGVWMVHGDKRENEGERRRARRKRTV